MLKGNENKFYRNIYLNKLINNFTLKLIDQCNIYAKEIKFLFALS
jgi:hypothetical protein